MPDLNTAQTTSPGVAAADIGELKPRRQGRPSGLSEGQWYGLLGLALTLLTLLGWWTYSSVSGSVKEIRQTGLATLLNTQATALSVWIEDRKRNAERWAAEPGMVVEAAALAELSRREPQTREAVCQLGARSLQALRLQPLALTDERVIFNLISAQGRILATSANDQCGATISHPLYLRNVQKVFEGQSRFVLPLLEAERVTGVRRPAFDVPLVWMIAPVRDKDGKVVAALAFGKLASAQFAAILRVSRPGDTGEAYAFDAAPLMLSEVRQPEGDGPRLAAERAAFGRPLRVPAAMDDSENPLAPPTRLAQAAINSRALTDPAQHSGTLLDPYSNYRGTQVIGAWRWFSEYELGLALEIEAIEAYEPLRYLTNAFLMLFMMLLIMAALALLSSWWLVILRVREAKRVGRYTLIRQIGEGGISRVYLARHDSMKRPTAVKVLKAHQASDEMIARFEREVQLCSQLSHPNTIEIYDYGRSRGGMLYYAMEWVNGITLADLVAQHGSQSPGRVIHILLQVCGALKEAHDKGLIHRDIKPQNIMLSVRGGAFDVAKLLDFGLVKEINRDTTRDLTQYARVLGTPLYMAPERLRNPADADSRADIYAIAATAFYLLTGRYLFEAESDHELTYQILNTPAPRVSPLVPGVPVQLDDLLQRCLAKDREDRPRSADELIEALEALSRNERWTPRQARQWWIDHAPDIAVPPKKEEKPEGMVAGSHGPLEG